MNSKKERNDRKANACRHVVDKSGDSLSLEMT